MIGYFIRFIMSKRVRANQHVEDGNGTGVNKKPRIASIDKSSLSMSIKSDDDSNSNQVVLADVDKSAEKGLLDGDSKVPIIDNSGIMTIPEVKRSPKASPKASKHSKNSIPFIIIDDLDGKFHLTDESVEYFKSQKDFISIITVNGRTRTGKSTWINNMLEVKMACQTSDASAACTKGFNLVAKPERFWDNQIKEHVTRFYIDIEGFDAVTAKSIHDHRLYQLSIMIASEFVYNVKSALDTSTIDNLRLVMESARKIPIIDGKTFDDLSEDQRREFYPSFLCTIQSSGLKLIDPETKEIISAQKYFENSLKSSNIETYELIQKMFRSPVCFELPPPVSSISDTNKMDNNPDVWTDAYANALKRNRDLLQKRSCAKRIQGKMLNGPGFIEMVRSLINIFNDGTVPCIANTISYWAKANNDAVLEWAKDEYQNMVGSRLQLNLHGSNDLVRQGLLFSRLLPTNTDGNITMNRHGNKLLSQHTIPISSPFSLSEKSLKYADFVKDFAFLETSSSTEQQSDTRDHKRSNNTHTRHSKKSNKHTNGSDFNPLLVYPPQNLHSIESSLPNIYDELIHLVTSRMAGDRDILQSSLVQFNRWVAEYNYLIRLENFRRLSYWIEVHVIRDINERVHKGATSDDNSFTKAVHDGVESSLNFDCHGMTELLTRKYEEFIHVFGKPIEFNAKAVSTVTTTKKSHVATSIGIMSKQSPSLFLNGIYINELCGVWTRTIWKPLYSIWLPAVGGTSTAQFLTIQEKVRLTDAKYNAEASKTRDLEAQIADIKGTLIDCQRTNEELKKSVNDHEKLLNEKVHMIETINSQLTEELYTVKLDLNTTRSELQSQKESNSIMEHDFTERKSTLSAKCNSLEDQVRDLETKLVSCKQDIDFEKTKYSQMEATMKTQHEDSINQITILRRLNADIRTEADSLKLQLKDKNSVIDNLKAKCVTMEVAYKAELQKVKDSFNKETSDVLRQMELLRAESRDQQSRHSTAIEDFRKRLEKTQGQLQEMVDQLTKSLGTEKLRVGALEKTTNQKEEELMRLRKQLTDSQVQFSRLSDRSESLERENKRYIISSAEDRKKMDEIQTERRKLEIELIKIKTIHDHCVNSKGAAATVRLRNSDDITTTASDINDDNSHDD